jgi:hypothetical protein
VNALSEGAAANVSKESRVFLPACVGRNSSDLDVMGVCAKEGEATSSAALSSEWRADRRGAIRAWCWRRTEGTIEVRTQYRCSRQYEERYNPRQPEGVASESRVNVICKMLRCTNGPM